jgi:ribosomal protein S18 acetylase RimI-like enzyme
VIRLAVAADVPALAALAARTWLDAFGGSLAPEHAAAEAETGRSEARFAAALQERTILVAEADGALVGYVELGEVDIPEADAGPEDAELHRLYVDTPVQGRGIGRALLDAALAHPRLATAPRVFLQVWEENERAVRLYERAGFRRVGSTRFTIGSEVVEDAVLVLER